jgi:ferredoxin-thioredoxin reductase catalytic chain
VDKPDEKNIQKMWNYSKKFTEKTGTHFHPTKEVTEGVVLGLAQNIEEVGRPLCPCNFYPDKKKELDDHGRRWVCACDEMQIFKYCHCLLFVCEDGMPITEYLPEGHEAREMYGLVKDPTPEKGRALKKKAEDWIATWKEDLRSKGLPVPGEDDEKKEEAEEV